MRVKRKESNVKRNRIHINTESQARISRLIFFCSCEFIMKYIVVVQHKSPSLVWISDLESWFSIFRLLLLFGLCFGALENLA